MAYPSVTYTFSNGSTSDANQVNQNFTDIINGLSDGTKDLNVAAGSFAGRLTISSGTAASNSISLIGGVLTICGHTVGGGSLATNGGTNVLGWTSALLTGAVPLSITDATDTTSGSTGSLYTAGGIGVTKGIYSGYHLQLGTGGTAGAGKITRTGTTWQFGGTNATLTDAGAFSAVSGAFSGAVTALTVNKLTLTTPANGSTLTIADGKTLTASNTLTFTGTDGISVGFGGGLSIAAGKVATISNTLTFTGTDGITVGFGGGLSIAAGKVATISNTLTFTGTDSSSVAFGAGGTVAYVANKLSVFAATTSAELAGVISDETGSGALVFGTSPTFTTDITCPKIKSDSGSLASAAGTAVLSWTPTSITAAQLLTASGGIKISGGTPSATGTIANSAAYGMYFRANNTTTGGLHAFTFETGSGVVTLDGTDAGQWIVGPSSITLSPLSVYMAGTSGGNYLRGQGSYYGSIASYYSAGGLILMSNAESKSLASDSYGAITTNTNIRSNALYMGVTSSQKAFDFRTTTGDAGADAAFLTFFGTSVGSIDLSGNWIHTGYTQLGSDAPAIKIKKFSGTTDNDSLTQLTHGLTASKIVGIYGNVGNIGVPYNDLTNYGVFDLDATYVNFNNNNAVFRNKTYVIYVMYES